MEKAYTKEQFVEDLFEVANIWVEGIMRDLAIRADKLWENDIARKLVRKCAEERREVEKCRKSAFMDMVQGIEWLETGLYEMKKQRSAEYTNMVYELLVSDK